MLPEIKANLGKYFPSELVDLLVRYYSEVKEKFYLGRHENSELNGSKFAEVVFRMLQHVTTGSYVPLGKQISRIADECLKFKDLPAAKYDDSIRFHIPRTLIVIVDIRNKRDVGHVSGIHSPNLMDSTFVTHCVDWVMAELLRLYHGCPSGEAQRLVEQIIQRKLPIVTSIGDKKRVLNPDLSYADEVLILLYEAYPGMVAIKSLFDWVEHKNFTLFKRDVIQRLHKRREIEHQNEKCVILPPGMSRVEGNGLLTKV